MEGTHLDRESRSILSLNVDGRILPRIFLTNLIRQHNPLAILLQDLPSCLGTTGELFEYMESAAHDYVAVFGALHRFTTNNQLNGIKHKYQNVTLIHKSAEIVIHKHLDQEQASALAITLRLPSDKLKTITLINVYVRPHSTHTQLQMLLRWLANPTCPNPDPKNSALGRRPSREVIIMGDFNASASLWTPLEALTDLMVKRNRYSGLKLSRGRTISKFIGRHNLTCLNRPESGPTYVGIVDGRESYIDLAIVGYGILKKSDWKLFNIIDIGLEHRIISIQCGPPISSSLQTRTTVPVARSVLQLKRITEYHFEDFSMNELGRYTYNWRGLDNKEICARMNMLADHLVSKLRSVQEDITKLVPMRTSRGSKLGPFRRLHQLRHVQIKLVGMRTFGTIRRRRREKLMMRRKQLLRRVKRMDLWRRLKMIQPQRSTTAESFDTSGQEPLDSMADHLYPKLNRESAEQMAREVSRPNSDYWGKLLITDQEIDSAVFQLRHKSYHGSDKVSFSVFNPSYKYVSHVVKAICQMSFFTLQVPFVCQTTRGILIPKADGNQRLLHISTALSTVVESVAHRRLAHCLETRNLLDFNQYGFSPNKSRHDLLARIIELYYSKKSCDTQLEPHRQARNSASMMTVVNLDVAKAFDSIDHNELIKKLLCELDDDPIKVWLSNFLLHRKIILTQRRASRVSESRPMSRGVPQGSKLGPMLWNFGIHGLFDEVTCSNSHGTTIAMAYADDIFIAHRSWLDHSGVADETWFSHMASLQRAIDIIVERLAALSLTINVHKSSYMNSCDSENSSVALPLLSIYEGQSLQVAHTMNILGVRVNSKLHLADNTPSIRSNPKLQLNILILNTMNRLNLVRSGFEWRLLIESLIKSLLVYNNLPVFAIDKRAVLQHQRLFILAIRQIFEWPDNTSTKVIHSLFNMPALSHDIIRAIHRESVSKSCYRFLYNHMVSNSPQINLPPYEWASMLNQPSNETNVKRLHTDPKFLLTPNFLGSYDSMPFPCWTISHEGRQGTLMTINLHEVVIEHSYSRHSDYAIPYFNTLAALWDLVENPAQNYCRQICFDECHPLVAALTNINNHDWRTIRLREMLAKNSWNLFLRAPNSDKQLDYRPMLQSMKPRQLRIPNLDDYIDLNMVRCIHNHRRRFNLEQEQTTTLMRLLKINSEQLMKCNPSNLTSLNILALTGLVSVSSRSESGANMSMSCSNLVRGLLGRGQLAHGCSDESVCECSSDVGHTTYHRTMECPRFSLVRGAFETVTRSRIPTDLELIFNDAKKRARLLNFLTHCAFDNVQINTEDSDDV